MKTVSLHNYQLTFTSIRSFKSGYLKMTKWQTHLISKKNTYIAPNLEPKFSEIKAQLIPPCKRMKRGFLYDTVSKRSCHFGRRKFCNNGIL